MALISSVLNRTDASRGNLSSLVRSVITPNGQYGEEVYAGHPEEFAPVSESAFIVAGVIHESFLSTYSVPWKPVGMVNDTDYLSVRLWNGCVYSNASFYRLRGEGGILVSSQRIMNKTQFVGIEMDGVDTVEIVTVLLFVPDWDNFPNVLPSSDVSVSAAIGLPNSYFLQWNNSVTNNLVLYPSGTNPPPDNTPFLVTESIGANTSYWNTWGYTEVRGEPFH